MVPLGLFHICEARWKEAWQGLIGVGRLTDQDGHEAVATVWPEAMTLASKPLPQPCPPFSGWTACPFAARLSSTRTIIGWLIC